MSFGFSIGDFLAVIELATKVRKEFAGAPEQFKAISDEVKSLSILIQDVEVNLTNRQNDEAEVEKLRVILEGSKSVLNDLCTYVTKYQGINPSDGSGKARVRRAWNRFKFDAQEIRDMRDRLTSNVSMLQAFNERDLPQSVRRIEEHVDNQKRQQVLDWISPDISGARQNDLMHRREPNTREWLFQSAQWKNWLDSRGGVMYCPGIPGAGKTFTTAIAIERLQRLAAKDDTIAVSYVFCSYQRREENRLDELLARGLLRMLLEQSGALSSEIIRFYEAHVRSKQDPDIDEIIEQLALAAEKKSKTYIIVDALDELEPQYRNSLVSKLLKVGSQSMTLYFTSRKLSEIASFFPQAHTIEVSATQDDIQKYLDRQIQFLPGFVQRNVKLQQEIKEAVGSKVDGVFLLAELHMGSLKNKMSAKAVRTALCSLSTGSSSYEKAYGRAMTRVEAQPEDRVKLAKKALMVLTLARRPLMGGELCHALAVEPDEFDFDNIPDIEDVLSTCGGLVIQSGENENVELVHKSTIEYLESNLSRWFPNAESNMGNICLVYIAAWESRSEKANTTDEFTFLDYAQKHWGAHVLGDEKEETGHVFTKGTMEAGQLNDIQAATNNTESDRGISRHITHG